MLMLIILLPILEIYILIESGHLLGIWPTVGLVIATGIAGSWLLKHQGLGLLQRIQGELAAGHLPAESLLDGALLLAGGILLLTPGFCTDLLGFTMLIPGIRPLWRKTLRSWLRKQLVSGRLTIYRG